MLGSILHGKNIEGKGPFWWCAGQLCTYTLKGEKREGERGKNTFMKFKTNIKKHKIKVLIQSYPPPRQHHFKICLKKIYIVFSYSAYVSGFHDTK